MLRALCKFLVAALKVILVILFAALTLDVLWGVATRYLLGGQARWTEELARMLMVWLALLGIALVCREERNLILDVVVGAWPEAWQRRADTFGRACLLAFAGIVMAWGGVHLVQQRLASGQTLAALGISRAWFYAALPVSGALIVLFAAEALLTRRGEKSVAEEAAP